MAKGNYDIEEWTRQEVYLNKRFIGRALNEVCIGEEMDFSKMAKYNINFWHCKNVKRDYHENSGIIIATGTGSTGWPSLFKHMSRKEKSFIFSTILPATGKLNRGMGEMFEINYVGHRGKVAIDTVKYDFPRSSILEIKLSDYPLRVIIPQEK